MRGIRLVGTGRHRSSAAPSGSFGEGVQCRKHFGGTPDSVARFIGGLDEDAVESMPSSVASSAALTVHLSVTSAAPRWTKSITVIEDIDPAVEGGAYDHSASTRILPAFTAASRRSFLSCGANGFRSLS